MVAAAPDREHQCHDDEHRQRYPGRRGRDPLGQDQSKPDDHEGGGGELRRISDEEVPPEAAEGDKPPEGKGANPLSGAGHD